VVIDLAANLMMMLMLSFIVLLQKQT